MNRALVLYDDARPIQGHEYQTYHEAAGDSGLLSDGAGFDVAFQESVQIYSTSSELL